MTAAKTVKESPALSTLALEAESYFDRKERRQAQAWMPVPGSTIRGRVIKMHMNESDYGMYPVITYAVEYSNNDAARVGSTIALHAFHTVLRERLAELETDIDVVQWVTYDGKKESRTRKDKDDNPVEYHLYDVENDGQEEATGKVDNFTF